MPADDSKRVAAQWWRKEFLSHHHSVPLFTLPRLVILQLRKQNLSSKRTALIFQPVSSRASSETQAS